MCRHGRSRRVPPVVITTSTSGSSIQPETRAPMASRSSRTIAFSCNRWPLPVNRSTSNAPERSERSSRVSDTVRDRDIERDQFPCVRLRHGAITWQEVGRPARRPARRLARRSAKRFARRSAKCAAGGGSTSPASPPKPGPPGLRQQGLWASSPGSCTARTGRPRPRPRTCRSPGGNDPCPNRADTRGTRAPCDCWLPAPLRSRRGWRN